LALVDTDIQVLFGAVGPAVCSAAVKFGADLLAVGIERHNALGEFLFGHTLLEILSAAPCPVLTIRQWK
jgi:nucleotide-binding universal stress UspA family protein